MKKKERYYKFAEIEIRKAFKNSEVRCKCAHPDCKMTYINKELVKAYKKLCIHLKKKPIIHRGYACDYFIKNYPEDLYHNKLEEIDISYEELTDKYTLDYITRKAILFGFNYVKLDTQYKILHLAIRDFTV